MVSSGLLSSHSSLLILSLITSFSRPAKLMITALAHSIRIPDIMTRITSAGVTANRVSMHGCYFVVTRNKVSTFVTRPSAFCHHSSYFLFYSRLCILQVDGGSPMFYLIAILLFLPSSLFLQGCRHTSGPLIYAFVVRLQIYLDSLIVIARTGGFVCA